MRTKLYIRAFIFIVLFGLIINNCFSKTFTTPKLFPDSLSIKADSTVKDSALNTMPVSKNGPEMEVNYSAKDSIELDNANKVIYLYGNAKVIYGKMSIDAHKIIIYLDKNEVNAFGKVDSSGKLLEKVHFKDGEDFFDCPEMAYNFKTKKGKIIDIFTQEGEMYLHAQKAKRMPDESINVKKGKITTCDHPDPHFYFEASKLKVIPQKIMVAGFTHLVIRDFHTPLFVPFGIFPNNQEKQSGIIIPSQGSDQGQTGLNDFGYHWAINDYLHTEFLGSIYFGGTYRAAVTSTYNVKYKYTGDLALKHNNAVSGTKGLTDFTERKDYQLTWNHRQDSKAHPKNTFSAGINLQTGTYRTTQLLTHNSAASSVQGANISQIKFDRRESWGTISTNGTFNQNFQNKQTIINAPGLTVNVRNQKLFGALQISGNANFVNSVTATDSTFWEDFNSKMKNGLKATTVIDFGQNATILKYINLTYPNVTVTGFMNTKYIKLSGHADTVRTEVIRDIKGAYNVTFGNFGLATKVYGIFEFKDGMKIKGFRHTLTPSASLSYSPVAIINSQDINRTYINPSTGKEVEYSIYQNSNYSVHNPTATEQLLLSYTLMNNLQAKVREKIDSTTSYKKVNIINNFDVRGNYNYLADSLNWSDVNINFNTNPGFLKNLNVTAVISPYEVDSLGRKINELLWDQNKIGRLSSVNVGTSIGLSRKDFFAKDFDPKIMGVFNWNLNLTYTFTYSNPGFIAATTNNALGMSGNMVLSKNWKFQFNAPFNIKALQISPISSVSISRQIHCWEIDVNWLPFSELANYTFSIRPKSGLLSDLKYEKKSNGR